MRQTVKSFSRVTLAVTMLVGLTTAASAAPVLIVNAGFEAPSLGDSQAIFTVAGWTNSGDSGTFNPHAGAFASGAPEGENVAFSSHGGPTISQILSATAQANTLYTLTMLVGNRLDADFGGYQTELWAGGTMLAQDNGSLFPADGQFLMSTVQYFVASGDAVAGSALEIRFRSLGWQTVFDDVQARRHGTSAGTGAARPARPRRCRGRPTETPLAAPRIIRAAMCADDAREGRPYGRRVGHQGPTPRAPFKKARARSTHAAHSARSRWCANLAGTVPARQSIFFRFSVRL